MNIAGKLALITVLLAATARAQESSSSPRWLENLALSASAMAGWTDNLSRTSYAPTRRDAATYELGLSAVRHQQLAPDWLLQAGAEADFLSVPRYDRAGKFELGPRLGLQRKFGLGPMAPVLQFDAAYKYKAARIAADTGWTAEAGLRLAKRLTPALKVAASGRWLEHYARRATFDIQQRTFSVDATWSLSERWQLSGSAGRLSGRIVANAAWSVWAQAIGGGLGPTVFNYYNSIPWEVTDSYGPGWVSYNVEAHANLWSLALSCALSERTTLELRTSSIYVINKIDIRYPTDSWGVSLTHRF